MAHAASATSATEAPPLLVHTFRPADRVTALKQTADGFLWVGTSVGLFRFDGHEFVEPLRGARPRAEITAMILTADKRLLVADDSGGVWQHDTGLNFVPLAYGPKAPVRALTLDRAGALWIGTTEGLVRWRAGDPAQHWGVNEGLPPGGVRAVESDEHGQLWVGTQSGLYRLDPDAKAPAVVASWSGSQINDIEIDSSGTMFVATETQGLLSASKDMLPAIASSPWAYDPTVFVIHHGAGGNAWLGTGTGLVKRNSATAAFQSWPQQLFPAPRILALTSDANGDLWLGFDGGGMAYVDLHPPVRALATPAAPIFTLASRGNVVWLNSGTTLVPVDGDTFEELPSISGASAEAWDMRPLWSDSKDSLLVGGMSSGLWAVESQKLSPLGFVPSPSDQIQSLHRAADGTVWAGLRPQGLVALRGGTAHLYSGNEVGCEAPVMRILERDGNLFFLTNGGGLCSRAQNGTFRRYQADGVSANLVSGLVGRSGSLWIGTSASGLVRLHDGRFAVVDRSAGLPFDQIGELVRDVAGHVWMTSHAGIARVDEQQLEDLADGKRSHLDPLVFGMSDGLPSNDCFWGWAHTAVVDDKNRLWASTIKGIVVFEPPERLQAPVLRPPVFDAIVVDGRAVDSPSTNRVSFAAGHGGVEFHYAVPALAQRHRLAFRYQLSGFDKQWVQAGERGVAAYTNLPPATYTFRVQAFYRGYGTQGSEASLTLTLRPPFHRTAAFYVLLATVALGVAATAIKARRAQHAARLAALQDERARIARDVHDSLEQTFVALRLQIEVAARGAEKPSAIREPLRRASDLVARAMAETRSAIWALRSPLSNPSDLVTNLAVAAGEAVQPSDVKLDIQTAGSVYDVPRETQTHLVLFVREAITNALKHAAPTHITLAIQFGVDALVVSVVDDGRGFDAAKADVSHGSGGHYGVAGMRERAKLLGGTLAIHSQPGAGSRVELCVPSVNSKRKESRT